MDEKKTLREPERRRRKAENPLMQEEKNVRRRDRKSEGMKLFQKSEEPEKSKEQEPNAYKLLVLKIILVVLVIALIAAFIFEIGIGGQEGGKNSQGAQQTQTEEQVSRPKAQQAVAEDGQQGEETDQDQPDTEA